MIDWAVSRMTEGKELYDKDGEYARKGKVNEELLQKMMKMEYFQVRTTPSSSYSKKHPPKSTGRELFTTSLASKWKEDGDNIEKANNKENMSFFDFIATVTELTAWSIADAYIRFAPSPISEVIVSGGGSRFPFVENCLDIEK